MGVTPQPVHIRLPMRADAVSGKETPPGQTHPPTVPADPRTASQAPGALAKKNAS